ncbi:PTS system, fructose-specific IIA component [Thermotomaculum hydrothermale]|uniref:PTS system, fructose-specific IIA component n=1 Tax=Thermotomaculum hydrothermale TaxID=981385 RepID=A0A7R6PJB2_9BACT|nr:PTS sugar transporter subunit IIA [Thermotomaculum hydrothermale]BBB33609.1 PTS system, fructose-specific IIA component [Thermotomaculum hydrothermale]
MKLTPFLNEEKIIIDFKAKNKLNFFSKCADLIVKHHPDFDREEVLELFLKREETMSTGIGNGVAIPHIVYGKCRAHEIYFFKLGDPIDFNSLDGKPVSLLFVVIGNAAKSNLVHLQILAKLARLLKKDDFVNKLKNVQKPEEVMEIIREYE